VLVAVVEEINRANPAKAPQQVEALRLQISQGLSNSFGNAVQDEIVDRAEPRRNERLINQTYRRTGQDEEAAQ
jgi:peptidyl-prolyl cis-trans isomerase D